jgi:hypothetical protein
MAFTTNKIPKATGTNTLADGYSVQAAVRGTAASTDTDVVTEQAVREELDKYVSFLVFEFATAVATGDGKYYWVVPANLAGYDLIDADAHVYTASSDGTPTVQIHNLTDTADMLSTLITVDATEYDSLTAAAPPVVDGGHDDVANGDVLRIDVDVAGTGTKGLEIRLGFRKP